MIELTIKGDIKKLRLKEGDVIVVKFKDEADEATMRYANRQLREMFPKNQTIIFPHNIDISVKGAKHENN